ncbi:twin-arginine translocase subunit TatC [Zunongwangia sp. F363]|uniref:Sec-independent protein translocase protein TatC n=1 Tax=Autumnicola tepida TaxID=3075595 RepID=A0ABU3C9T1_9FLAO|nr:twin-arginine translocase subunit TatC [Zunongwangia sp. F363]MDT0643018.1 twin-arginine translocase subunit TatC [Zunongwangia sp. F363]
MKKIKAPQPEQEKEMSFLDHLEDLRWHLIRATLSVVIAASLAFLAKDFIFDVLLFGPSKGSFFSYKILCQMSQALGFDSGFCQEKLPFAIQSRTMGGQFSAHVWTSITAGFIVAFPYIIYEFWKFVAPAMHENERRNAKGFIFITSLLFFLGVVFGYYVITPLSINFLGKYQVSDMVLNQFDLSSYISLVRASVLASGLIFELPIVIYFLTKVGVVTPDFLKTYRKYALVVVLIVSAVITPPDIVSQIIVAIPVLILYEVSIVISNIIYKRELKNLNKKGYDQ